MSSSQPFQASSPLSPSASRRRRKSRFTYKQLSQLASYSTTTPLRVIAHIDLDAFYAQCEMVRLGVPADKPLAVQQWQGLIAINYPARAYGLSRHVTIQEARKACPDIIMQHVATWKEGEDHWAYRDDAFKNMGTHKVSLDPYREQSRKILATIKDVLPAAPLQKVEKASIDEVFLDLSAHVRSIMLERYPVLKKPAPYDDPTEQLPAPPTSALDWTADALVDLDQGQTEEDDPDWDDVAMNIGAEVVRGVRAAILERLHYTCSAGLARNKMLAKLGSGHKKPNSQTIVRNRAIQYFLSEFKFTKIRMLGGKLGDEITETFQTDTVKALLDVPMEVLKKKLGDDTGSWLHGVIRGEDHSEVTSRTQIKSMLSAKSFRPSINTFDVGLKWLRIFSADIFSRLVEEGVLENKRRPKTINLHHRQGGQTRSKSAPIPQGKTMDVNMLFELAKNLLAQVVVDGRAWPCANLSLSVGGFEDGPTGNKGIGTFLVRGDEARALQEEMQHARTESPAMTDDEERPQKKRRTDDRRINLFFNRQTPAPATDQQNSADVVTSFENLPSAQPPSARRESTPDEEDAADWDGRENKDHSKEDEALYTSTPLSPSAAIHQNENEAKAEPHTPHQTTIERFFCERCKRHVAADQREEHDDWHFAKELQEEQERLVEASASNQQQQQQSSRSAGSSTVAKRGSGNQKPVKGRPKSSSAAGSVEKGQKKLAFG